jgi:hypothetical protein
MSDEPQTEMPRYLCHKKVWALKIADIKWKDVGEGRGTATITPTEKGYAPFDVDFKYMTKHQPQVGGYYVVYDDGYKSFSPAKAFEEGYTLVEH